MTTKKNFNLFHVYQKDTAKIKTEVWFNAIIEIKKNAIQVDQSTTVKVSDKMNGFIKKKRSKNVITLGSLHRKNYTRNLY